MRLQNKVAIVTGAASGFGAEIARQYVAEGAMVAVADINEAGAKEVAAALGANAIAVKCDVTQRADVVALVKATVDAFGALDIVINNAGWTHRKKPFLEVTEAEFDQVYAVNVKSIFHSVMHALPIFRKQGGGCFVNVASTAGLRPRPGLSVYNSSKAAVILMSKSMAGEFGPDNVRINCVNPVFSPETGLSAEFAGGAVTPEARKAYLATIPLGRFSTPADVANACLYLASDEASMISGTSIEVDGARCV